MGSPCVVQIAEAHLAPATLETPRADIDARRREINRQMSHYDRASELSGFNRAAAGPPFRVSPEFARVVRFSLDLA